MPLGFHSQAVVGLAVAVAVRGRRKGMKRRRRRTGST
jgi:hypothetical protein